MPHDKHSWAKARLRQLSWTGVNSNELIVLGVRNALERLDHGSEFSILELHCHSETWLFEWKAR